MIPRLLSALALLAAAIAFATPCTASPLPGQAVGGADADGWTVYGVKRRLGRDAGVPGGMAMSIEAPRNDAEPWESAASTTISVPVRAGEAFTAVMWMRVPLGAKVTALLASNTPPYPSFAHAEVTGTGAWRREILSGVVHADAQPGQDALVLHLGAAGTVDLGPAFILRGIATENDLDKLAAAYAPDRVAEDVTFPAPDGVTLAGTLRTPPGRGPFPVVVTIPGSGPQTRGGFVKLNERLLPERIATLEYDKRGNGQSGGTRTEAVPVLAGDAAAAARFLAGRRDVDKGRIVLLGQSQGGLVVATAAAGPARDLPLRGVALLVSPALSGDRIVTDQVARQLQLGWPQGGSYEDQRAFVAGLIAVVRANPDPPARRAGLLAAIEAGVRTNRIPKEATDTLMAGFTDPSMRDAILDFQAAPVLERLRIPVLSVYASKDILVSASQNAPAARRAFRRNPRAQVVELEGLNHMLQVARTGGADEWSALGPPFSANSALDLVTSWLERRLRAVTQ